MQLCPCRILTSRSNKAWSDLEFICCATAYCSQFVKEAIVDVREKQKAFDPCSPHETAMDLWHFFSFQAAKEQITILLQISIFTNAEQQMLPGIAYQGGEKELFKLLRNCLTVLLR